MGGEMVGNDELKIGDVVHLKGGKLQMTVVSEQFGAPDAMEVSCAWHAGSKPERAIYPIAALERVEAQKK